MTKPPPSRKVSNLVSFFESANSPADPLPARPLPSTRSILPTPLPPPLAAADPNPGTVLAHVRRLSLDVVPKADVVRNGEGKRAEGEAVRGRLSEMDWSSRPKDMGQVRAESRGRTKEGERVAESKAVKALEEVETVEALKKEEKKEKGAGSNLAQFRPGRIAPPPPLAPAVLIPATVAREEEGKRTKVEIARPASKAVEMKRVEKEVKVVKHVKVAVPILPPLATNDVEPLPLPFTPRPTPRNSHGFSPEHDAKLPARSDTPHASKEPSPSQTVPLLAPPRPSPRASHPAPKDVESDAIATPSQKQDSTRPPTPPPIAPRIPQIDPFGDDAAPPSDSHQTPLISRNPFSDPKALLKTPEPTISDPLLSPLPRPAARPIQSPYPSLSFPSPPSSPRLSHSSPLNPHHHASVHQSYSSARTITNIPASHLFRSGAPPLVLPALDRYIDSLGATNFSEPEEVLSEEEKKGWSEWVGREERKGWRKWVGGREVPREERELVFPLMHLVPEQMTVTDLKRNKRVPFLGLDSVLGSVLDGVLAAEGSSYGISLETVESFRDIMQMVTLLMGSAVNFASTSWYHTLFVTLPSFLSLDFVSSFGHALIWLWIFTLLAFFCIYELWRFTGGCKGARQEKRDEGQGYDREGAFDEGGGGQGRGWRDRRGYKIAVTFGASSLYLPLSKLAVGALAWTSDYWAVEDPYALSDNPVLLPLGPSETYYDPLDFCYKTTMLRPSGLANFNFAYLVLPIALSTVCWLTIWLPWRLHRIVQAAAPRVDPYTEFGERRRDVTGEYERLLELDTSPFSFLYQGYRRPWASFKSIYMLVKLVNILLIVLLTKENCIFRNHTRARLSVVRQATLLVFMALFLLADTISKPFVNYISNNSDRVSRIGFVLIALIGLLVALKVPGNGAFGGWVLVLVSVVVYGFNGYFTVIGTGFAQRFVKGLQYRLDFSIDLFSPHLDIAKHVSRRIWQETLSTILLAAPEYKMAEDTKLAYTNDPALSPYLLGFRGSQAERHVENLKVLREIGLEAYNEAMQARCLPGDCHVMQIRRLIQQRYTGPDIVWHAPRPPYPPAVTSFFGRLDVNVFPFSVVFRYDQDPTPIYISHLDDLELLVRQNESKETRERRRVRVALRALDGQVVFAPHSATTFIGRKKGVEVESRVHYRMGLLKIGRNSRLRWRDYNYASGFDLTVTYSDGQGQDNDGTLRYGQNLVVDGAALGIPVDFSLSPAVAKLLRRNRDLIEARLPAIEGSLSRHREFFFAEANWKHSTLSHGFLFNVVAESTLSPKQLDDVLRTTEADPKVQNLAATYRGSIKFLDERMKAVMGSRIQQWWFVAWDDIWRRNGGDIARLRNQPAAFSPHYRTSICYRPMSRPRLEAFLRDHGFWQSQGARGFFNSGFLNRIYFYLDEIIFGGTSHAIPIHLGTSSHLLAFSDLEHCVPLRTAGAYDRLSSSSRREPSKATCDTGGGTDHDDSQIRARQAFRFEEIFDPPRRRWSEGGWEWVRDWLEVAVAGTGMEWLGLRPYRHENRPRVGRGVTLDLRRGKEGWEVPRGLGVV